MLFLNSYRRDAFFHSFLVSATLGPYRIDRPYKYIHNNETFFLSYTYKYV